MLVFRHNLQLLAKIAAIGIRQFVIQQDQIGRKRTDRIKQPAAHRYIQNFKLLIPERFSNDIQDGPVVV